MISFWLTSTTRVVTEYNWSKAPMGGAEISAVNLGNELRKAGIDTTYYLQRCEPFDKGKLHVKYHAQALDDNHDYFICVRPHRVLAHPLKAKKKLLWSGDAFDQTSNEIFFDKTTAESLDAFVFKTDWQRRKILEKFFYVPENKCHVIYNGVKAENFETLTQTPVKNRFIHASTWYRGLGNFIDIWPRILDKIPDAEIHVFSKTSLYSDWDSKQEGYARIAEKLCGFPGMILREPVPQNIITQEMRKSWLMLYPNSGFVESSCGSVMQSIAAGTPVVTTARAGLVETVGDAGILIPETEGWKDKFVEGVIKCQSPSYRNQLSLCGRRILQEQSWTHQAQKWLGFLKSL